MFYEPVLTARWFKPGIRYSDINWNSFPTIVSEFDGRLREWYLNPGKTLTVSGSLTVNGLGSDVTILGAGGTLVINNPSNTSVLSVDNGTLPTLDLSGAVLASPAMP